MSTYDEIDLWSDEYLLDQLRWGPGGYRDSQIWDDLVAEAKRRGLSDWEARLQRRHQEQRRIRFNGVRMAALSALTLLPGGGVLLLAWWLHAVRPQSIWYESLLGLGWILLIMPILYVLMIPVQILYYALAYPSPRNFVLYIGDFPPVRLERMEGAADGQPADRPPKRRTIDAHGDETMSNLGCPHCGKLGITMMRKIFLGAAMSAKCRACGKKIGVPYAAAMLALTPFFVAFVFSSLVAPFWLKAALWAAGIVAASVAHILWVPLRRR